MFKFPLRVYYEDTDAGGVVYHSNYLNFMERCRSEWLNSLGYSVLDLSQKHAIVFVVSEAKIHYHAPARLLDELWVSCQAVCVGKVRIIVEQKIYNQDVLLCSATIKLGCVNAQSLKIAPMPNDMLAVLQKQRASV